MRKTIVVAMCGALAGISGCESSFGPDSRHDATGLDGYYEWVLEQWSQGAAIGYPVVNLSWELPARYSNEPFRVYAAYGGGGYGLIATVTSCSDGICRYSDTNVVHGRTYDYYVATLDERDGHELGTTRAISVNVPALPNVTTPGAPTATPLDGAAYLQWTPTGATVYQVLSQAEGGTVYMIGETDGTSFFDDRAENSVRYEYYLAGVDEFGHTSGLSQGGQAIPRPDFFADVLYEFSDLGSQSGFRFVADENADPILAGDSPSAQWRLESVNGSLAIRPLGQTTITGGTFTTELTCGPGSDETCVDLTVAPAPTEFGAGPVSVESGSTYFLRVIGADGMAHYGKIRVQGTGVDSQGRDLMIFDWAYQLRADEPRLVRVK
ncbi:MAG: hypothetical protein WD766_02790 [Gemmatimonadota bacterium]